MRTRVAGRRRVCIVIVVLSALIVSAAPANGTAGRDGDHRRVSKRVRVLTLNVLHGLSCAPETDFCQAGDRAQIVARAVQHAGCPELVGFQEIGPRQPEVFPPAMAAICGGRYELAWQGVEPPVDRTMIFTTLPIIEHGYLDLAAFPWEAYWVRVLAPIGPVDFLTTHFASSANNPICSATVCPPKCPAGITANQCNAIEVVRALTVLDALLPGARMQIASGDFNARPGSPALETFERAGFVDGWLAAGEPECDPTTGYGCTSGRDRPATALDGLDVAGGHYRQRIDFVLARPGRDCRLDVTNATPFVAEPLAHPYRGLFWPSDHAGVDVDTRCRRPHHR